MRKFTFMLALALIAMAAPAARSARAADSGDTPWLGVYTQTVDASLREAMDLSANGALVSRVVDDSPADRAGLRKGDVITRLGPDQVESSEDLQRLVSQSEVGRTVTIEVRRGNQTRVFNARLEARSDQTPTPPDVGAAPPAPPEAPTPPPPPAPNGTTREWSDQNGRVIIRRMGGGDTDIRIPDMQNLRSRMMMMRAGRGRLGVQIQDLNDQLGDYFEVPDGHGVLVTQVIKDTPAERAGLKAGDVITRVDDSPVANGSDLIQALADKEGRVTLSVIRHGRTLSLEAALERREASRDFESRVAPAPSGPGPDRDELNDLRDQVRQLREEIRQLRDQLESSKR